MSGGAEISNNNKTIINTSDRTQVLCACFCYEYRLIPAAFFDRFCLWSSWSSSTLPRLVCLVYVRSFYFLFCCVEVSSVVLCLLCCVALCCNPLCCVALRCVAIRCVVSVLLHCVALCCDPLCRCYVVSVELHCVVLHCDPFHCVAL